MFFDVQQDGRGLQDPERYKAKQKKREEIEKKAAATAGHSDPTLKVMVSGDMWAIKWSILYLVIVEYIWDYMKLFQFLVITCIALI